VERAVFFGIIDEMLIRVKILKERISEDPNSILSVIGQIESIENEIFELFDILKHT
jgi:hypothetical protein